MSPEDAALTDATFALNAAEADYQRERGTLYLANGNPKYSEEEQQRRHGDMLERLDARVGLTATAVDRVVEANRLVLADLEAGDPFDRLAPDEQTAASARKAFIQEDAARLPHDELADRMRMALRSGDRPTMYLLARYVGQRLEASDRQARDDGKRTDMTTEQVRGLGDLVGQLVDAVRGVAGRERGQDAASRLKRAQEVRRRAAEVYDTAHDTQAKAIAQMRATGRYSL